MKARIEYAYQEGLPESERCVAHIYVGGRIFSATALTWQSARSKVIDIARAHMSTPKPEEVEIL